MRSERIYLNLFLAIAVVVPTAVAALNWAVDPYGFFSSPSVPGFNAHKPEMGSHEKELKAHRVTVLRPGGLILGASNSDVGLDPAHPGWMATPVYNLAVGSSSITLAYQLFMHSASQRMPEQVVLGIELGMFNPAVQNIAGLNPADLAVDDTGGRNRDYSSLNFYAKALSLEMLGSSLSTLAGNRKAGMADKPVELAISDTGVMNPAGFPFNRWQTYRERFQPRIAEHLTRYWAPLDEFVAIDDFAATEPFARFADLLKIACAENIDLHIVISPVHAYLAETKNQVGVWDLWERWKRAIVEQASRQAREPGCRAMPVWDFSGYNHVTTEVIPESRKPDDAPGGYWDTVHYRQRIGDRILNRIFDPTGTPNDDFGMRLDTTASLDDYFAQQRLQREAYAASRVDELALVTKTIEAALPR